MIYILLKLTNYDKLPLVAETKPSADFTGIKCLLNSISQYKDGKIDGLFYNTALDEKYNVCIYIFYQVFASFMFKYNPIKHLNLQFSPILRGICIFSCKYSLKFCSSDNFNWKTMLRLEFSHLHFLHFNFVSVGFLYNSTCNCSYFLGSIVSFL